MRASRSGVSQVMVGRDDELRQLLALVAAAEPSVAILAGEPGIGKSRLVQELVAAQPANMPILIGQADPGALSRPFELLLDAVDGCASSGRADPALLETVSDAGRAMVERLRAGLETIRVLTTPGPSIVVFEDLHWADSESVALFERIADLSGSRLLIGTYRPDEVTRRHPVAELLPRLERRHTVHHLRLDRLSLADTSLFLKAVLGKAPSYRTAVALHNRTGGNPFFLEELLKARGDDDIDKLCDRPLPWNVAEALRRQLDDLDPSEQRVVEAAAVLGRKVPFDLLAAVTKFAEDDLILAMRDLVRRGLMVETGEDEFSFRHALTREALVDQMLGRQRRRLHELALETLLESGSTDFALVAHHARGAGRYLDMVEAARRGLASYLAIGSPYQALQLAEMGLDEVPDDAELLRGAARSAWLAGLLDDAEAAGQRWLASAASPEERSDALRLLVRLGWESDRLQDMRDLTNRLKTEIERLPDGPARGRAYAAIAQSAMLLEDTDEAVAWSDRAIAAGEELGLPDVWLAGKVEKGSALANVAAGRHDGVKLLTEAADEAEAAGEWLLAARALNNLIAGSVLPGTPAEWAASLERMRRDAERAGFDALSTAAYFQGRARLAVQDGDLRAAIEALDAARRRDTGLLRTSRGSDYHGVFLAGLLLEAGEVDRAEGILIGLHGQADNVRHAIQYNSSIPGLAFHIACRRGDRASALKLLADVRAAIELTGIASRDYVHDLVSAGLAAGLTVADLRPLADVMNESRAGEDPNPGDHPSADNEPPASDESRAGGKGRAGSEARTGDGSRAGDEPPGGDEPRAGSTGRAGDEPRAGDDARGVHRRYGSDPWGWLVEAQLAEAGGELDVARRRFVEAADWGGPLLPGPRATAHIGAARCLATAGQVDEARRRAEVATVLLSRWAGWRVSELAALRGRLGMAESVTGAGGAAALTPREREVAVLLAEGLTNAELARRLFISPRTAAVHVSNILSKLNVTSRTQVAARLRQQESAIAE